jgi:hypothetical protein
MPGKTKKLTSITPVTSRMHADKRANIPTEELWDFIAEEENKPKILLYPTRAILKPATGMEGQGRAGRRAARIDRPGRDLGRHPGALYWQKGVK